LSFYRAVPDGLTLTVRATPKSSKNAVAGTIAMPGGLALKVLVSAPPDKGKANQAVCDVIAGELGVPKSAVSVIAGLTDRRKIVHVSGDTAALSAAVQKWTSA